VLPLGERVSLGEIQKMAKTDPQLQNLSDVRKKELIEALEEHRKVKEHGLRASNMSASLDVRATMDRIGSEVRYHSFDQDYQAYIYLEMDKLSIRTGIRAFAFISRSHLMDVSTPGWLGSGDVVGFFPTVLKMSVDDFSAKFEQWSVTQDRRKYKFNCPFCISHNERSSASRFSEGSESGLHVINNQRLK